jgi:hypothetical protein
MIICVDKLDLRCFIFEYLFFNLVYGLHLKKPTSASNNCLYTFPLGTTRILSSLSAFAVIFEVPQFSLVFANTLDNCQNSIINFKS